MRTLSLSDFDGVPKAKDRVADSIDIGDLPSIEQVRREARWSADMTDLFDKPASEVEDRSAGLARMAYSAAEMGWSDEQIAAMLYDLDGRWKKYTARKATTRDNILLNLINRAREKIGYQSATVDIDLSRFRKQQEDIPVVTDEERPPLIYGFQDFVDASFPINWLIEGLLPQAGMMFVTGFPGTGKTQLASQIGAYVALGYESILKWDIVGGKKKVVFLSLEMGPAPFHLFMETIGKSYDEKKALNANFRLMPLGEAIPLDTAPGQAFLDDWLEREKPDLLIIDSLQLAISKEMTDELAAKNLMHYLALVRKKHNCAVLMIHHNRKKSAEAKQKDITQLSDMYGSIFFAANADAVLSLDKLNEEGLLSMHILKNRLGREHAPFEIVRDEHLHFSTDLDSILSTNIPVRGPGGGSALDV